MPSSTSGASAGERRSDGNEGTRPPAPDAAVFAPLGWAEAAFRRAGDAAAAAYGLDGLTGPARGGRVIRAAVAAGLRPGPSGRSADGRPLLVRVVADGSFACDLGLPGREAAFRAAVGLAHRSLHWRGGERVAALASPGEGPALTARWEARWFAEGFVGSEEAVREAVRREAGSVAAAAGLCWLSQGRFGDAARFWGARHAGVAANDP